MASERPTQLSCGWCNTAVQQPETGRLRRYCDRSCRQRAYEIRAASRRLQEDLEAGLVHRAPAETVRRAPRPAYPNTVDGWEQLLVKLAEQLRGGRFVLDRGRLRDALLTALHYLPAPPDPSRVADDPQRAVPQQRAGDGWAYEDELGGYESPATVLLAEYLHRVAGRRTTLRELAAELDAEVHDTRAALRHAVLDGYAEIRRDGAPVDVDALDDSTHFRISGR